MDSTNMAQTTQVETGGEVILNSPPKTIPKFRKWKININNYTDDDIDLFRLLAQSHKENRFAYQFEVGEECGTPHLEGIILLKNARTFSAMKKKLPRAHIEVMKGTIEQAFKYVTKLKTRIDGPWTNMLKYQKFIEREPYGCLDDATLKDWQVNLLAFINEKPDYRTILWIYDEEGNSGKTSICKHICQLNIDALYVSGRAADMKFAIAKMLDTTGLEPRVVLMDIPRSREGYVSYGGIEEIKNGIFFSGKYESGMFMYDNPHVIVMANFLPEYDMHKLIVTGKRILHGNEGYP